MSCTVMAIAAAYSLQTSVRSREICVACTEFAAAMLDLDPGCVQNQARVAPSSARLEGRKSQWQRRCKALAVHSVPEKVMFGLLFFAPPPGFPPTTERKLKRNEEEEQQRKRDGNFLSHTMSDLAGGAKRRSRL